MFQPISCHWPLSVPPRKYHKTSGFLVSSGDVEKDHWHEMGKSGKPFTFSQKDSVSDGISEIILNSWKEKINSDKTRYNCNDVWNKYSLGKFIVKKDVTM